MADLSHENLNAVSKIRLSGISQTSIKWEMVNIQKFTSAQQNLKSLKKCCMLQYNKHFKNAFCSTICSKLASKYNK